MYALRCLQGTNRLLDLAAAKSQLIDMFNAMFNAMFDAGSGLLSSVERITSLDL